MKPCYKSFDELPVTLNAIQVASVLGISRATAYNLLRADGFPTIHIGNRKLVLKDSLRNWMNQNMAENSNWN